MKKNFESFSVEERWTIINSFVDSGLSLRRHQPKPGEESASPAALCQMLKKFYAEEGFDDGAKSGLSVKERARILFLSLLENLKRSWGGLTTAQIARLALRGSDEEIYRFGDNRLLRPLRHAEDSEKPARVRSGAKALPPVVIGRAKPGQVVDLTQVEYRRCKAFLKKIRTRNMWLGKELKEELRKCYRECGCGSRKFGLVCSVDEYVLPYRLDWQNGEKPSAGSRVLVVVQEGPVEQIVAVMLIPGAPLQFHYARAIGLAINNNQRLTLMKPQRPAVLICDNTKAASQPLSDFCDAAGITQRWARYRLPHAKRCSEKANHILRQLGIPEFTDLNCVAYRKGKGVEMHFRAEDFFNAVLVAAFESNRERSRNKRHTRAEETLMMLDFYRQPLEKDGLPVPSAMLLEGDVFVKGNAIQTSDGAIFQVEGSENVKNGATRGWRCVAPGMDRINFMDTDCIWYSASMSQPGLFFE